MEGVPPDSVHEILPEFHHTFRRYEHLEKAIQADPVRRAGSVQK